MFELYRLIEKQLPSDHSRQVCSEYYIKEILGELGAIVHVLDLGCGNGRSVDEFRKFKPDIKWHGLDIEGSPEVLSRTRTDVEFFSYDGVNIPFDTGSFDFVYSNQTLEHVRYPRELLQEINRVLKPCGYFAGSLSQLEPYHSYSVWNYTPYGLQLLLEEAQFEVVEFRPGIDAATLIARRMLGRPRFFDRWFENESPVNRLIGIAGKLRGARTQTINAAKLLYCGQFCFSAQKQTK